MPGQGRAERREPNERPAAQKPPVGPECLRETSRASTESRKPQHDKSTAHLTYTTRIKKRSHATRALVKAIPSIRGLSSPSGNESTEARDQRTRCVHAASTRDSFSESKPAVPRLSEPCSRT